MNSTIKREAAAMARTLLKCAGAVLLVYIGAELVVLWLHGDCMTHI